MAIFRKNNHRGQTALILILLAAAALIFLAITLNWGRISQTKTTISIAADQTASQLASDAASYGEMEKQTNLKDTNQISGMGGLLFDIIMIVVVIVVTIITIFSCGATSALAIMCYIALAAALATAVLQLTVIQPGMDSMWNKLQANQPITQQFFEQAVGSALQGSVSDQVNITDYFDSNADGRFGPNGNDSVSRFAFFYTERLKMLNGGDLPEVDFFYKQLNQFINGNSCLQNVYDNQKTNNGIPINPSCIDPGSGINYCGSDPNSPNTTDPACYGPIPATIACSQNVYEYDNLSTSCKRNSTTPGCIVLNPACSVCEGNSSDPSCQNQVQNQFAFQLNDTCTDSKPGLSTYNPYCDACCQPMVAAMSSDGPYRALRPSSCWPPGYPNVCATEPSSKGCYCTPGTSSNKSDPNDPACDAPQRCSQAPGNPFNTGTTSGYPYLYDPSYQEYANGTSFLDLYGRDQPMITSSLPLTSMSAQGAFPNGVFPFFWLMNYYSPEVDNINNANSSLDPSQYHWCAANATINGQALPAYVAPSGFADLNQLTLPYTCSGKDCCVNYFADSLDTNSVPDGTTGTTVNGTIDIVGNASLPNSSDFGENETGKWLPGDNQMCMTNYTYNNKMTAYPDGTCEWTNSNIYDVGTKGNHQRASVNNSLSTIDELDEVMHTLSDFDVYAQSVLNTGTATLNSTFDNWYPQIAAWIAPQCGSSACNPGGNGRLLNIYNPGPSYPNVAGVNPTNSTPVDVLGDWNKDITSWLSNDYSKSNVWCLPPESIASGLEISANGTVPTAEDTYIHQNATSANWGDISHVIACLNYNATQAPAAYQACLTFLQTSCPASSNLTSTPCDPATLGRSLLTEPKPTNWDANSCNASYVDSKGNPGYAKWVSDNATMFTDQAPKFALRASFLQDIYTRAINLQQLTAQGEYALQNFLKPCSSTANSNGVTNPCGGGGPAAQLIYRRTIGIPSTSLPNTVIYGWVDKTLPNGKLLPGSTPGAGGYTHLVKVTAYSPGRNNGVAMGVQSGLPVPVASSDWFTQSYTLNPRDGNVYVSVRRWDQDHDPNHPVQFPNQHNLWQFLFHNPSSPAQGEFNIADCTDGGFGIGLQAATEQGLRFAKISPQDTQLLQNAFMLNDVPNGKVDTNNSSGQNYSTCLGQVNNLLGSGMESHACARYVAALHPNCSNTSDPTTCNSGNGDSDYSIMFVDCNKIDGGKPPKDSF